MGGVRSMPVLAVRDVEASVAFYRDVLGFEVGGLWGDEGDRDFGIVRFGTITLALQKDAHGRGRETAWSAYLYVTDVDATHARLQEAGAPIKRAPEDAVYGCRDFDVLDPDGHLLAFGQDLSPGAQGPGL